MVIKTENLIQKGEIEVLIKQIDKLQKQYITFIKNQTINFIENITSDDSIRLMKIFYEDYIKTNFINNVNENPIQVSIKNAIKELVIQSEQLRNYVKDQYLDNNKKDTKNILYLISFNVYNIYETLGELRKISEIFNKLFGLMNKLKESRNIEKRTISSEIKGWLFIFSDEVLKTKIMNHQILEKQYDSIIEKYKLN